MYKYSKFLSINVSITPLPVEFILVFR